MDFETNTVKAMIWMFAIILFSSCAFAALTDGNEAYLNLNDNLLDSTAYHRDFNDTANMANKAGWFLDGAYHCAGNAYARSQYDIAKSYTDFSLNMWFNSTSVSFGNLISRYASSGYSGHARIAYQAEKKIEFMVESNYVATSTTYGDGNWHMVTLTCESGVNCKGYINGVQKVTVGYDGTLSAVNLNGWEICARKKGTSEFFIGGIDEVGIWNKTLSTDEITTLYNSGSGYDPYNIPPPPSLNLSTTTPANDSGFNTNPISFTVLGNFSLTTNCTLNINGTANITQTGISPAFNKQINFTQNFTEGFYDYNITCSDGTTTASTTTYLFFFDATPPTITTGYVDYTLFYNRNLTGVFNISDNDLIHSVRVEIDGDTIHNVTGLGVTLYQYNLSRDVSNLTNGLHTINITFADGHTAQALKGDYLFRNGLFNQYSEYVMYDGSKIRTALKESSWFDDWKSEKKKDRYTQLLKPSKPANTIVLVEDSEHPIHIYNHEKYNGDWIVFGDHWKDYVLVGEPDSKVSIKRLNPYSVEVTITGINNRPEELVFNSIGDLNIVSQTYYFTTTTLTTTYSAIVYEMDYQTVTLVADLHANITSTDANLTWNGTGQSVTKTSTAAIDTYSSTFQTPEVESTANISLVWDYSIVGSVNTETGNITLTQTIYNIGIDNCSTYTTKAINITIRDESTDSVIPNATLAGYFEVWVSEVTDFVPFNLSWAKNDLTNYSICINPPGASYIMSGQMEYAATNYDIKTYYFINTTLDNSTDTINLYLTNDTTSVTFNVLDQNNDGVGGVYIYVQAYDLTTNTAQTVEILKTDDDGQAVGNIVLTTKWYKFILIYEGSTVLETQPKKILSSPQTFRINLITDYFVDYTTISNTQCDLTFSNATKTFVYTWTDTTGNVNRACLEIVEKDIYSSTKINTTCVSSASGTILTTITQLNKTYIGTGTLYIDDVLYVCESTTANFRQDWRIYGGEGLFISIMLITTLTMVGIWNPIAAIAMLSLGFIITNIIGIFVLDWPYIITFIILTGIVLFKLSRRSQ